MAFGHVLRGLGIIYNDMERVADIDDTPKEVIFYLETSLVRSNIYIVLLFFASSKYILWIPVS